MTTSQRKAMDTNKNLDNINMKRRGVMVAGLAGASSLILGEGGSALAQEMKKPERKVKVLKEAESMTPGVPKVRLREVTWDPGAVSKGVTKMPNAMVCECSQGSFEATVDGKTFTRTKGDIWTCKPGQMISDINKGKSIAVMRIFDLLPA